MKSRVAPSDDGDDASVDSATVPHATGTGIPHDAKWIPSTIVMTWKQIMKSTIQGIGFYCALLVAVYVIVFFIAILPSILPFGNARNFGSELTLSTVIAGYTFSTVLRMLVFCLAVFCGLYRHRVKLVMYSFILPFCGTFVPVAIVDVWLYRLDLMPRLDSIPLREILAISVFLVCITTYFLNHDKRWWCVASVTAFVLQSVAYEYLLSVSRSTPSDGFRLFIRLVVFPLLSMVAESAGMTMMRQSYVVDGVSQCLVPWPGALEFDWSNIIAFLGCSGLTAMYSRLLISSSSTFGLTVLTIVAVGVIDVATRLTAAWRWELILRFRALDFWKRRLPPHWWDRIGCSHPIVSLWDKESFAFEYISEVTLEGVFILIVPTVQTVSWFWARYNTTAPRFYDWAGWELAVTTTIAGIVQLCVYATVRTYYIRGGFDWDGLLRQLLRPHVIMSGAMIGVWITFRFLQALSFWDPVSRAFSLFCVGVDDAVLRNGTVTPSPSWTQTGWSVYNWTVVPPVALPARGQVERWIFSVSTTAEAVHRVQRFCSATSMYEGTVFQALDFGRREAFCCDSVGYGAHLGGQTLRLVP